MTDGGRLRLAVVVSTAGSVINEVLHDPYVCSRVQLVVADRPCEAVAKARAHGLETVVIDRDSVEAFCDELLVQVRECDIDYVVSYYTDFYAEPFRAAMADRIVNLHPSLLPAFKGADGFGDAVAYPARFTGNTLEFIADVMDEGKIIMQTVCPIDLAQPIGVTRHRVFVQQCKALRQVVRWLQDGRISVAGRTVTVHGARFDDPEFSPALEDPQVRGWTVPWPGAVS